MVQQTLPEVTTVAPADRMAGVRRILLNSGVWIILIVLVAIVYASAPSFRSPLSLVLIGTDAAFIGIIAAGQTMVILTGGIDLSVEAMIGFSSVVAAMLISGVTRGDAHVGGGMASWLAMLIAIGLGTVIGLLQGIIVTGLNIHPFIVTLGFLSILQGAALALTDGSPINVTSDPLIDFLSNTISIGSLKLPMPLIIMAVIYGIVWVILRHTKLGRYTYAIGGNETATRLSGINISRSKIILYGISGMLSAISGMLLMSRLSAGAYQNGTGYTLNSVAAVVIGGTALAGGIGGIWGTFAGVFVIVVVQQALVYMDVTSDGQKRIVIGIIIVLAVAFDVARRGRVPAVQWVRQAMRSVRARGRSVSS